MMYKVDLLPRDFAVVRSAGSASGAELRKLAEQIEGRINKAADKGYDLVQVGQVSVEEKPGCLGSLFGQESTYGVYNMLVFRK